jgi:hypothetical protein
MDSLIFIPCGIMYIKSYFIQFGIFRCILAQLLSAEFVSFRFYSFIRVWNYFSAPVKWRRRINIKQTKIPIKSAQSGFDKFSLIALKFMRPTNIT